MEPQFVERPEMILVGIVGTSEDVSQLDIAGLWQRFDQHSGSVKHQIEGKSYEVHIQEKISPTIHFCLAGVEVREINDLPMELFAKTIPGGDYAIFTHRFKDGGFGEAFLKVYEWLENSDYMATHPFDIQCYDERFTSPEDPESILEIYVPIKSK